MRISNWKYVLALLLGLSHYAYAGRHHICYEDAPDSGLPTAVWGCTADGGETCRVQQYSNVPTLAFTPPPQGGSYVRHRFPQGGTTYSLSIWFYNSAGTLVETRQCDVNTKFPYSWGAATQSAQLTGFTTDSSGLVTTGVWKLMTNTPLTPPPLPPPYQYFHNSARVDAPKDFVAVGGGVAGVEAPYGALIRQSVREDSPGTFSGWRGGTIDNTVSRPHQTTVYVIGMRIANVPAATLFSWIRESSTTATSITAPHPTNSATIVRWAEAMLGGGVTTNPFGQYLTKSIPTIACGDAYEGCTADPKFEVASKDHMSPAPGTVFPTIYSMPLLITVAGQRYCVDQHWITDASWYHDGHTVPHPTVTVGGLRGQYALTGIGAWVHWEHPDANGNEMAAGNLLWKLEPRPDIGGATVASKDHALSSPAWITATAIGIRLRQVAATGSVFCNI